MASAEQVKALIKAHFDDDNEKFKTVALQIAAHEAKAGHSSCAVSIKELVQGTKYPAKKEMARIGVQLDSLDCRETSVMLSDIVLTDTLEGKISRVIYEFQKKEILRKNGLKNRSKILLTGDPGTGKTMTASVIAHEIHLPLYVIRFDRLVTKYMGETSAKLRQVFDYMEDYPGVYLFDEFDAIGSDRHLDNDVGEMRRILNSFLQYLEDEDSFSLVIAATNNADVLDKALFRRFDDVLEYHLPDNKQIIRLLKKRLGGLCSDGVYDYDVIGEAEGLNHSDISKACDETLKISVLEGKSINKEILINALQGRKELYQYKEG